MLLAAVTIVDIASIYLAQPLLPFIGADVAAGETPMAAVHAGLQVSFGAGLVLVGLFADAVDRRRLLMVMGSMLAASATLAAASTAYVVFLVACLAMGASAAVLPVVIAVAVAANDRRALLSIISAAPAGILIGRVGAGLIGGLSWRVAFAASALGAAASVVAIARLLPRTTARAPRLPLGRSARRLLALGRNRTNLLLNISNGTMLLGWSAVWTILAFLLEGSAYGFGAPQVGLVALAGLGGVVSGQAGARLVGAVGEARAVRGAIVVAGLACLGLALSATSLVALLVALFVHNTAVWTIQAINIPAAARRAGPTEAARGTALLYLTNFICTGIGAVVGALVWSAGGWPGIGLLAAACCIVSLGLEIVGRVAVDGGTDL